MAPNPQAERKDDPFAHHGMFQPTIRGYGGRGEGAYAAEVLADSISVAVMRLER